MKEDILGKQQISLKHKVVMLVAILLINCIFSFLFEPLIFLTENQILYLMSTMAQVTAGLFGLVLAAYAIIDPKLKAEGYDDEKNKESLDVLRQGYYKNILYLSVLCGITIGSCLLTLGCFETFSSNIIPIFLNQSVLLCVISIFLFLMFGCSLLNPKALSNLNARALEEVNAEYTKADLQLRPFIDIYNRLEALIFEYAAELIEKDLGNYIKYDNRVREQKMQIFQALNALKMHEIINSDVYIKIDELRRYRNALVHSIDEIKVNSTVFNDLKEMYQKLYAVYISRNDEEAKNDKIKELKEYGEFVSLGEKDKRILELLYKNPDITLKEISLKLECSRATISRRIEELCKMEKLKCVNGKYEVLIDKKFFQNKKRRNKNE